MIKKKRLFSNNKFVLTFQVYWENDVGTAKVELIIIEGVFFNERIHSKTK